LQKKYISSLFLLIILLPACGPSVAQPQPTAAPLTLPPTWTPTPLATGLPTSTEIPTFTPVPAFTPLSTPTRDPLKALSERFQDSLFSPNGRWTAYRDPDKLRVVNNDDPMRVWTLPCALFDECSTVFPVKWSRNSQILYFAPSPTVGGAPSGISLLSALAMINVRTGKWEIVLPDSDRHYDFAFSPDDDYIAYTQSSGEQADEPSVSMGVLTLENKKVPQQFTLDGAYGGNIVWSPFKPRFVFVTYDPEKGSAIVYYDIDTNFIKYALEVGERDIILSEWDQNNLVSLEEKDWVTQLRSYRVLNPFTGELVGDSITATPAD
jgi:dipeptidyl aminopeptidase/acylaminoacyl peptidase